MQMDEEQFDYRMECKLAMVVAVYGNGEGAAIAEDLGLCYWCAQSKPCRLDHSAEVWACLDERLDMVRAQMGLDFNC